MRSSYVPSLQARWGARAIIGSLVLLPSCRDRQVTDDASSSASSSGTRATKVGGTMILATTTSTRDSGLLDELVPLFEASTGVKIKVIAVGTGAALRMAAKGDADAVLVHAPAAEKVYVDQGDLVEGRHVMHNDFVLLGPPSDPAGVKSTKTLDEALAAVAKSGTFVSRGDDSGTHKKELSLWKSSSVAVADIERREETGQGMGATLHIADERSAYTLSDRATYLAHKGRLKLQVVSERDRRLINHYHVYVVSPTKHEGTKAPQARAWAEFLMAPETQTKIAGFGVAEFGEPLFVPDGTSGDAPAPRTSAGPTLTAPPARSNQAAPAPSGR